MVDIVASFVELFRGRGDAYGSWDGGCVRDNVTPISYFNHLHGKGLMGVYPLVPHNGGFASVWGCTDIDVDDLDAARNLQLAFSLKGIESHIEKTVKGYHIWVFAVSLVPSSTMRRAFLAAHQAINYPAKEVNPKQEDIGKGLGNYVRLPYPGELETPSTVRYMLDDNDNPVRLQDWVVHAISTRTDADQLSALAEHYVVPVFSSVNIEAPTAEIAEILRKVPGYPYQIWKNGPLEGSDRSSTLFRLAYRLSNTCLTASESFAILKSADERWGKFHLRSDGDNELLKMIHTAFGVRNEHNKQD